MGAHRALCPALCETWAIFDPFSPMTAVTTVFPYTRLLRFLLGPETQIMTCNKIMFYTENARLLWESAGFALWTYASPVVGDFQAWENSLLGPVPALCRNAPYGRGQDTSWEVGFSFLGGGGASIEPPKIVGDGSVKGLN